MGRGVKILQQGSLGNGVTHTHGNLAGEQPGMTRETTKAQDKRGSKQKRLRG
jgi:hypothetical protein